MSDDKWVKIKDGDAVLDYLWNWTTYLGDDTLTDAAFTVNDASEDNKVALDDSAFTATTATAWLSGGETATKPTVTCHITTAAGRQDDRTLYLNIREL